MTPFPSWILQEEGNCQSFQNVVDVFLDVNNILWALDTGIVNSLDNPICRCPPKVVAICLKTKKVCIPHIIYYKNTIYSRMRDTMG